MAFHPRQCIVRLCTRAWQAMAESVFFVLKFSRILKCIFCEFLHSRLNLSPWKPSSRRCAENVRATSITNGDMVDYILRPMNISLRLAVEPSIALNDTDNINVFFVPLGGNSNTPTYSVHTPHIKRRSVSGFLRESNSLPHRTAGISKKRWIFFFALPGDAARQLTPHSTRS